MNLLSWLYWLIIKLIEFNIIIESYINFKRIFKGLFSYINFSNGLIVKSD